MANVGSTAEKKYIDWSFQRY